MRKQQIQLIRTLAQSDLPITSSSLANALNISPRSVKTYINEINEALPETVSSSRKGYQIDKEKAAEGEKVKVTLKGVKGYEIRSIKVIDLDGKQIELGDDNSFVMPSSDVTVTVDAVKIFTLEFDLNGGTYNGKSTYIVEIADGTVIKMPEPVKDGYAFLNLFQSYYDYMPALAYFP